MAANVLREWLRGMRSDAEDTVAAQDTLDAAISTATDLLRGNATYDNLRSAALAAKRAVMANPNTTADHTDARLWVPTSAG